MCSDCYENVVNSCSFKRLLQESDKKIRVCLEDPEMKLEYLESIVEEVEVPNRDVSAEEIIYDGDSQEIIEEDLFTAEFDEEFGGSNDHKIEGQVDLKCYICNLDFETNSLKLAHFQYDHKNEPENKKCSFCSHTYKDSHSFNTHLKQKHPNFKCPKCSKKCYSKESLEAHLSDDFCSTKPKKFKKSCPDCNHIFTKSKDFQYHMCAKEEYQDCSKIPAPSIACYLCNKTFRFMYLKKTHLEEDHLNEEYKCTFCDSAFKSARGLDGHLRLHYESECD